jgi:hypothetical protein
MSVRGIALLLVALSVAGCGSRSETPARDPATAPATIDLGARRIEGLIACYKVIILAQRRFSGTGSTHDGIAGGLEASRRNIEARLIGDLTDGRQKARLGEQIEARLQALLEAKPYTSGDMLRETARLCADRDRQDAWSRLPP